MIRSWRNLELSVRHIDRCFQSVSVHFYACSWSMFVGLTLRSWWWIILLFLRGWWIILWTLNHATPILCKLPKRIRGHIFGEQFIGFTIYFHFYLSTISSGFLFGVWFLFSREQLTNCYHLGLLEGYFFLASEHVKWCIHSLPRIACWALPLGFLRVFRF